MQIVLNDPTTFQSFVTLNTQWIKHYFTLEDADRTLFANPMEVIEKGGYIIALVEEGDVIGTCAVFNEGHGVFELAKMAVCQKHQGKGYANKLMEFVIELLYTREAKRLYLLSNTQLKPALKLYEKYGFKVMSQKQHPLFTRVDIILERDF